MDKISNSVMKIKKKGGKGGLGSSGAMLGRSPTSPQRRSGSKRMVRSRSLGHSKSESFLSAIERTMGKQQTPSPVPPLAKLNSSDTSVPSLIRVVRSESDKVASLVSPRRKSGRKTPRDFMKRASVSRAATARRTRTGPSKDLSSLHSSGYLEMRFNDNSGVYGDMIRYWLDFSHPRLLRYADRSDPVPVGVIMVAQDQVVDHLGKEFTLRYPSGEKYEFRARNMEEAEQWVSMLRTAIATNPRSSYGTRTIAKGGIRRKNMKLAKVLLSPRAQLYHEMSLYSTACLDLDLVKKFYDFSDSFVTEKNEEGHKLVAGTLDDCLAWFLMHCTMDLQSNRELSSFLLSAHRFCAPHELVTAVERVWKSKLQRYPYGIGTRLKNFLRQFILTPFMSEEPKEDLKAKKSLLKFCSKVLDGDDRKACLAMLDLILLTRLQPSPPAANLHSRKDASGSASLKECSSSELAQLLTEVDEEFTCRLQLQEFADMRWQKKKSLAPNLVHLTENFNTISTWVAYTLLKQTSDKERCSLFTKYIRVARHLMDICNYNTAAAVVSGLTNNAVGRLKHINNTINPRHMERLEKLQALVSPDRNYAAYRSLPMEPPCIPFFAVYMRDLTFADEGNPTYLDEAGTVINFAKVEQVGECLRSLALDREQQYCFEYDPSHLQALKKAFKKLPDEDGLYEMSVAIEPVRSQASNASPEEEIAMLREQLKEAKSAHERSRDRAMRVVREITRTEGGSDRTASLRSWVDHMTSDFSRDELLDTMVQVVLVQEQRIHETAYCKPASRQATDDTSATASELDGSATASDHGSDVEEASEEWEADVPPVAVDKTLMHVKRPAELRCGSMPAIGATWCEKTQRLVPK